MAVLGGAILPPIQGRLRTHGGVCGIRFIVPLIAYAYVAFTAHWATGSGAGPKPASPHEYSRHDRKTHSAAAAIGFRSAVLGLIVLLTGIARAQTSTSDAPWFGAEMCLEPGDKPADIDTWFRQLKAADMEVTRIRLFERYMRTPSGASGFLALRRGLPGG